VSHNVDLNTATEQDFGRIAGMNKEHARKIMEFRSQNGPFKTWEDLKKVPGLPGNTLETLKRQGYTINGKVA
jgi:competence protein ComEA